MSSIIALRRPYQPIVSAKIRAFLKGHAAMNGGLKKLACDLGENYDKVWHQANRGQGVLADLIVNLARKGIDEPLRVVADKSGFDITPKMKFLRNPRGASKPVRAHMLSIYHALTDLSVTLEDALKDQVIDARDEDALKAEAFKVKKVLAEFEARIEGGSR